jgi:hypothetical protein
MNTNKREERAPAEDTLSKVACAEQQTNKKQTSDLTEAGPLNPASKILARLRATLETPRPCFCLGYKKPYTKTPILRGCVIGTSIFVHCPWCDCEHRHGWHPENVRPEHRGAHCHIRPGPFTTDGYYIAPFRKKDRNYRPPITWVEFEQQGGAL